MSIFDIQDGLATRLATIDGLRTANYIPDQINPPVAIPIPTGITYDTTFARGMDEYAFTILVLVGAASDRTAQALMARYCAPSGAASIKAMVEADKTLGGAAFDCRVMEMRNYQQTPVGDQMYLSAEFTVQVYAQ
jgi:hypothetical protein